MVPTSQAAACCVLLPSLGALLGLCGIWLWAKRNAAYSRRYALFTSFLILVCAGYGYLAAYFLHFGFPQFADKDFKPTNVASSTGILVALTSCFACLALGLLGQKVVQSDNQSRRLSVACSLIDIFIEAVPLYALGVFVYANCMANELEKDFDPEYASAFAVAGFVSFYMAISGTRSAGISVVEVEAGARCVTLLMVPIVYIGVTALYGLITCVTFGGNLTGVAVLYLVSGALLDLEGSRSIRGSPSSCGAAICMILKLTVCQAIGLAGLVLGYLSPSSAAAQGFVPPVDPAALGFPKGLALAAATSWTGGLGAVAVLAAATAAGVVAFALRVRPPQPMREPLLP